MSRLPRCYRRRTSSTCATVTRCRSAGGAGVHAEVPDVCRLCSGIYARKGEIPGVIKSSW